MNYEKKYLKYKKKYFDLKNQLGGAIQQPVAIQQVPIQQPVALQQVPIQQPVAFQQVPIQQPVEVQQVPIQQPIEVQQVPIQQSIAFQQVPIKQSIAFQQAPIELKPSDDFTQTKFNAAYFHGENSKHNFQTTTDNDDALNYLKKINRFTTFTLDFFDEIIEENDDDEINTKHELSYISSGIRNMYSEKKEGKLNFCAIEKLNQSKLSADKIENNHVKGKLKIKELYKFEYTLDEKDGKFCLIVNLDNCKKIVGHFYDGKNTSEIIFQKLTKRRGDGSYLKFGIFPRLLLYKEN